MPTPVSRTTSSDVTEAAIQLMNARGKRCGACDDLAEARQGHDRDPVCEERAWQELAELVRRDNPACLSESVAEQAITGHLFNDIARTIEARDGSTLGRWRDVPPELRRVMSNGLRGIFAQINAVSRTYPSGKK